MKKLLLVDGNSIMNRAFFGIPLLTNSEGEYTNAIYGFINIVTRILEEEKADHMVVSFDLKGPTFRHLKYEDYKGTRKGMPDELRPQMTLVKEVLGAMGITICSLEGYEADDVLGTLSVMGEQAGYQVALLSGDRDMLQLASEQVKIIIPKTKGGQTTYETYYAKDVIENYGVTPKEFIDVKGLMGDTSDNIPGIPGVGEKTAIKLIAEHHTIEAVYEARDSFSKGLQEKVSTYIDQALMSRDLATIVTDTPLDLSLDSSMLGNIFNEEAFKYFVRLNLNSLLDRFEVVATAQKNDLQVINISDVTIAMDLVSNATKVWLHVFNDDSLFGVTFAVDDQKVYYMDENHIESVVIKDLVLSWIQRNDLAVITHDLKNKLHVLGANEGIDSTSIMDVSLMMYLINPVTGHYEIDKIASEYAGVSYLSDEGYMGKGKSQKNLLDLDAEDRLERQGMAITILMKAYDKVLQELIDKGLMRLYETIERPLLFVLYNIEKRGVKVDGEQLKAYGESLSIKIASLEASIYEQAGQVFNIGSPKQLGVILFEHMKMPFAKKTKTGYSTSVDVLEKLRPYHPIIEAIMEYRTLTKLKSTYADGLFDYILEDGRIHSTFNQRVTSTGRISSTDPNLQNIPIRMEIGRQIRKVFIPEENHVFIDADYSQIELRLLAHLSGDESFIKAFREELDVHRMTASQVFHVPFSEVTDLQRRNAKAVNFGIVYGISAFGLSQDLDISVKEASDYIDQYFAKYPKVKSFLDDTVTVAKDLGYVTTMWDRVRPIPELASSNFVQRSFGERVAMNTPLQGSAADIIKIAMIKVEGRLKQEGLKARLILQVHDELVIEAPVDEQEIAKKILVEEMEAAAQLSVPLTVDAHIGYNWYEAK